MKHFVLKLGTKVVSLSDGSLATERLSELVSTCAEMWKKNKSFVVVSSGAIGLGRNVLQLKSAKVPALADKQASAAVGQSLLMRYYFDEFQKHGIVVAQILVTAEDFSKRENFLNLQRALERLCELNVIPILNENDCVVTREIDQSSSQKSFGDNDGLSAIVASKLGAELLILLTDVDAVYTANPRNHKDAQKILQVNDLRVLASVQTKGKSEVGRGGMASKLMAAKMAAMSGCATVIASGFEEKILEKIFSSNPPGTWIRPADKVSQKKQWIATSSGFQGVLILNSGAADALTLKRASVLAVGVLAVKGKFPAKAVVSLQNEKGDEIGRGVSHYSSADVQRVLGLRTEDIKKRLGKEFSRELVHRDKLVLFLG